MPLDASTVSPKKSGSDAKWLSPDTVYKKYIWIRLKGTQQYDWWGVGIIFVHCYWLIHTKSMHSAHHVLVCKRKILDYGVFTCLSKLYLEGKFLFKSFIKLFQTQHRAASSGWKLTDTVVSTSTHKSLQCLHLDLTLWCITHKDMCWLFTGRIG